MFSPLDLIRGTISDRELARRSGVSRDTICSWRRGRSGKPRRHAVEAVASVLNVPAEVVRAAILAARRMRTDASAESVAEQADGCGVNGAAHPAGGDEVTP